MDVSAKLHLAQVEYADPFRSIYTVRIIGGSIVDAIASAPVSMDRRGGVKNGTTYHPGSHVLVACFSDLDQWTSTSGPLYIILGSLALFPLITTETDGEEQRDDFVPAEVDPDSPAGYSRNYLYEQMALNDPYPLLAQDRSYNRRRDAVPGELENLGAEPPARVVCEFHGSLKVLGQMR